MLNQPDTERYLSQIQKIREEAEKVVRKIDRLEGFAQEAVIEFNENGTFSQQNCEDMNPLQLSINRKLADLTIRASILRGDSWYFLDEGMQEGDSPPCDC